MYLQNNYEKYHIDILFYMIHMTDSELFDILIPVGPDDYDILLKQIKYTIKNVIGYRNIYILSNDILLNDVILKNEKWKDNIIFINENIYPFSLKNISEIHGENSRNGWYLQQLLKLYAFLYIPNILDKYLVIDADTFFLKPTIFIENNIPLYNVGDKILERNEYHIPYFEHMKRLHEFFEKVSKYSGISHHMLFEKKWLQEIFLLVENKHGEPFWKVFLNLIDINLRDTNPYPKSGASEYELYFNYMIKFHPNEMKIRELERCDLNELPLDNTNYDYVSLHYKMRI